MANTTPDAPFIDSPDQGEPATDTLLPWFEAIEHASARSRWMTIVMTTASILTFVATWNTMPHAWLRNRLSLQETIRELAIESSATNPKRLLGKAGEPFRRAEQLNVDPHDFVPTTILPVGFSVLVPHPVGHDSATGRTLNDTLLVAGTVRIDLQALEEHEKLLELDRKILAEVKTVDVPALGIAFDINDLGLLAGIAFFVILLMRKMSMNNEYQNLRATFLRGYGKKCLRDTYELVAMRMVLTVPFRLQDRPVSRRSFFAIWLYRVLAMSIDLAPVAVLALIYTTNWQTYVVGSSVSPKAALISMTFTLVFLVATAALTTVTLWTEIMMHKMFDVVAQGSEDAVVTWLKGR